MNRQTEVSSSLWSWNWWWFCTFPCQLAMILHFLLPKLALFVSSVTLPFSPFFNGHHCGAEIRNEFTLTVAKKIALFVPTLSNGASRATSDRRPKKIIKSYPVPDCSSHRKKMNQIITKNYWKQKKRLCMRWLGVINLTWENLQIAKHKSIRWDERTPSWFVLCDLQIFSLRPVKPCPGVPGIHLMQTVLFLWPRLFCAAPRRHLCTKFADAPRSRSDRGPCACAKTFLGDVAMVKKWRPRTSCTSCSSKKTIGCQMLLRWSRKVCLLSSSWARITSPMYWQHVWTW